MANWQGEVAALFTACCWSVNSTFFSLAGRRVGSPFPFGADTGRFLWFSLSGLAGFVAGDGFLFEAFVRIGPRLSMLIMVLAPVFTTLLAWVFLGETLAPSKVGAIILTLAGIGWVVSATGSNSHADRHQKAVGILLGLGGALGQAGGYLFSKVGMADGFSPVSGNLIRLTAAALTMGIINLGRGRVRNEIDKMRDRKALGQIAAGALFGPVLGVVLSLYALAHAQTGVASTLMSLAPVFLLPISHFVFGERITLRAVSGTLAAVLGAALLFFLK